MFSVVKTRKGKKGRPTLSVVPSNWVGNNCVFWPPNELISLSHDGSMKPELNWKATEGKAPVKAETFELAEARLSELLAQSDSEDAGISTRAKLAAKKQKLVETLDQSPTDTPNSQPTQISLLPLTRTTPDSGAARKILQALPASGSAVDEPTTSNITAVSGGNNLSAEPTNKFITLDGTIQMLVCHKCLLRYPGNRSEFPKSG